MNETTLNLGMTIGSWELLSGPHRGKGSRGFYECKCECGIVKMVEAKSLSRGESKSCKKCSWKARPGYHGKSNGNDRLYRIWKGLKVRCHNEKREKYPRYGGRGILVCKEWDGSYQEFERWAKEQDGHDNPLLKIDRVDNDGPYSPTNCRFVTNKVNCWNKSNNRLLSAFGETKCEGEWAEDPRCKTNRSTLKRRILDGWEVERAITAERGSRRV